MSVSLRSLLPSCTDMQDTVVCNLIRGFSKIGVHMFLGFIVFLLFLLYKKMYVARIVYK